MADRSSLVADLLADLAAESDVLDSAVADLEDTAWLTPTPAEGWTVAHQIAHLAWTDEQALLAATDPEAFTRTLAEVGPQLGTLVDDAAGEGAAQDPAPAAGPLAGRAGPPSPRRWRTFPTARSCPGSARR